MPKASFSSSARSPTRLSNPAIGCRALGWQEVFNTDSGCYGGSNVGNGGVTLRAERDELEVVLPACGVLVFLRK
jgi:1,4-alpha-glucan branching enzyme